MLISSSPASKSGIAFFGGSFDPVHVGHLWMAESALEQLPVDHVRWFPAATSPLKPQGPVATNDQRLAMLRLALDGAEGHQIDTWELDRDVVSYTVDTLRHLSRAFPDRPLYLVIGADSLASFAAWKDPEEILQRCTPAVIVRGGHAPPDFSVLAPFADADRIAVIRRSVVEMPQIEVSSSDLRQRVSDGKSIRFFTPPEVAHWIACQKLYRH